MKTLDASKLLDPRGGSFATKSLHDMYLLVKRMLPDTGRRVFPALKKAADSLRLGDGGSVPDDHSRAKQLVMRHILDWSRSSLVEAGVYVTLPQQFPPADELVLTLPCTATGAKKPKTHVQTKMAPCRLTNKPWEKVR